MEQSTQKWVSKPQLGSLKDAEQKKKQVFKPILDNPYTQSNQWSELDAKLANDILELLCLLLAGVGKYQKMKSESKKGEDIGEPAMLNHMTLGFNSTIKRLESQADEKRQILTGQSKRPRNSFDSYLKYVFVAKNDISPPILTQSFPVLCYTASQSLENRVKLIELPKGSMERLSSILNIKHTGIIGITENFTDAKPLLTLVDGIKDVDMPWLSAIFTDINSFTAYFHKPAIKVLATTAPAATKKKSTK